ncbi:pyruvate dehydrogenase E1 component alpha subunit [Microbacteriaceae bacterium MWH-Ta3]|nr:pyruvate dehydrogenase E1 component alpha subunit [Microbacteriaceae bacterium MWH-Ta3]
MPYTEATLQLLTTDGTLVENDRVAPYRPLVDALTDQQLQDFYREMVVTRRFDIEAGNLQRQGQLALWIPSLGQEAAQVGSAFATRSQDTIFPSYREHSIARIRGIDPIHIIELLRGVTNGGWNPNDSKFRLYTLVLGTQTLHAAGYAMGIAFDGKTGTGNLDTDEATIVYFGDGSSSEGDVNEAMVFAQSYQSPLVFFLQNNQYAISVPVERQSRSPLYKRGEGFGIESHQIDGNDVLISYAVTRASLDEARAGKGPRWIEAQTYRLGAHTTSDDPTKYRQASEEEYWKQRDPISRYELFLRAKGASESFFAEVKAEGEDLAADIRARTVTLTAPPVETIFNHVYTDEHPLMAAQHQWLKDYDASFGGAS